MMYKRCLTLLLLTQSLVLTGCGQTNWCRDRGQDYKKARALPVLKVPKGMQAESFSDTYMVSMPDECVEAEEPPK